MRKLESEYPVGTPMEAVDRTGPTVGGSEAPVIALGQVYDSTPAKLFLQKLGREPMFGGNKFTELGHLLEPYIREWAQEFWGDKIEEAPPWVPHPERKWQRASLDGYTQPTNGGGGTVYEFKTTSRPEDWGESWDPEGVPARVEIQCQHNMEVVDGSNSRVVMLDTTGLADRINDHLEPSFLRQLVRSLNKRCYELFRNRPYCDQLTELELVFVRCVETQTPPEAMNVDDVRMLYPSAKPGTSIDLDADSLELCKALQQAREDKRAAEKREKDIAARLGQILKGCSAGDYNGQEVIRWKNTKGFDLESFKAKHPALYENYCLVFDGKSFAQDYPDLRELFMKEGIGPRRMTLTNALVEP